MSLGFPGGSAVTNLPAVLETQVWYLDWYDSPGGGHGHPLQYCCLENPMDRGACGLVVTVALSQTQPKQISGSSQQCPRIQSKPRIQNMLLRRSKKQQEKQFQRKLHELSFCYKVLQWWRVHLPMQETSGSIHGLERSPAGGNDNPLQYSCLGNPTDRGAWRVKVQMVTKSQTQLSKWECTHTKNAWSFLLCAFITMTHGILP